MNYIISIDIGTTSTKAIAFDEGGQIISKKNIGYELLHPQLNYSEQNPDIIFNAVVDGLLFVQNDCKLKGKLIGVSFSAAMHSIMCVDELGKPLTQLIVWADNRAAKVAEKLKLSIEGEYIHKATGTPIHPMSPLCKIVWFRENDPGLFKATHKFIGIKEYIFLKFFNKFIIDYSVASATGLFDINSRLWSSTALSTAQINSDKLSEIVSVFHIEKLLSNNEWSEKLNIPIQTPFVIGGNDGCLANLGVGAIDNGNLAVTIGTSGAIRAVINKPFVEDGLRNFCYLLTEDHFVVGGATNNGAIILEWLQNELFSSLKKSILSIADLSTIAETIPPGSDGLIFLPYLLGERAPIYNPDAKGMYFGITINHTQAHFIRAAMEGIIFAIYSIGKVISENIQEVENIFVSGGFAHSKFWVQMLADVFGKKVILNDTVESSAFGAALIGWRALGIINDFKEINNFIHPIESFEPEMDNYKIYKQNFLKYERLYEILKDEF